MRKPFLALAGSGSGGPALAAVGGRLREPAPAWILVYLTVGGSLLMGDSTLQIEILARYGWLVLFFIVMAEKIGPTLVGFFTKNKAESVKHARDMALEEKHRQASNEERQIKAIETIAQNSITTRQLVDSLGDLVEAMNRRMESHEKDTTAILSGIEVLLDRRSRSSKQPPKQHLDNPE